MSRKTIIPLKKLEFKFREDCIPYEIPLLRGLYFFESWGAQGGGQILGGRGGYTAGMIRLKHPIKFYLIVGGRGLDYKISKEPIKSQCGGGGNGGLAAVEYINELPSGSSGGGATSLFLNLNDNISSRILVSGGGGGGTTTDIPCPGGYGGGLQAGDSGGNTISRGASQDNGYKLGYGQNGRNSAGMAMYGAEGGCGAGGGYYGGFASQRIGELSNSGGGGGSSYISGHPSCILHSSGIYFNNTIIKSGNEFIFLPNGEYSRGNVGDGYFRITVYQMSTYIPYSSYKIFPRKR